MPHAQSVKAMTKQTASKRKSADKADTVIAATSKPGVQNIDVAEETEADRIRDRLNELNVVVMDGPDGATWRMKG